jgi:hypothetical protein
MTSSVPFLYDASDMPSLELRIRCTSLLAPRGRAALSQSQSYDLAVSRRPVPTIGRPEKFSQSSLSRSEINSPHAGAADLRPPGVGVYS